MPTITDDFLTAPLGYHSVRAGFGAVIVDPTTVNLDTNLATGQALTMEFTIPPAPAGSPDGLWDEVSFTYSWESTNASLGANYDGAWTRFHLTQSSNFTDFTSVQGPLGAEEISDANATVSVQNGTATITFTDIAAGTYRLFVGENDQGDAESLNISVTAGQALELVPCFARGSLIEAADGPVAIETLAIGDLILTENGPQPIRWIGSRKFSAEFLAAHPKLRPIRIKAGVLGHNIPETDLVVSPQHRILIRSAIAQRMFGTGEVLVAAKQLLELDGVEIAVEMAEVEYFHLMFDQHEIILSNGAKTESMYAGKHALLAVGDAAREEIFTIFPELRLYPKSAPAAMLIPGRQARQLVKRHKKNTKPMIWMASHDI